MVKRNGCPMGSIKKGSRCVKQEYEMYDKPRYFLGKETGNTILLATHPNTLYGVRKEAKKLGKKTGKNYQIVSIIGEVKWVEVKRLK